MESCELQLEASLLNRTTVDESFFRDLDDDRNQVWPCAIACSALVGLTGVFPLLLIPFGSVNEVGSSVAAEPSTFLTFFRILNFKRLRRSLLGFACGSLLSDVLLHLLPECYSRASTEEEAAVVGALVVAGVAAFGLAGQLVSALSPSLGQEGVKASGWLNLAANCADNFTHGLAVGGAFLAGGRRAGVAAAAGVIAHEIPHEVKD